MNKIAKICYGLGFASIALSAYVYGTSGVADATYVCLLYTSPSPRDVEESRMPSSA